MTTTNFKSALRTELLARRDTLVGRAEKSSTIIQSVLASDEFQKAKRVLSYVSVRSEVDTHSFISSALHAGKEVVVPYCEGKALSLFVLKDFSELKPGTFGILEPETSYRQNPSRRVKLSEIDLGILPGVGFDPCGYRLGYGKGHFDRLLSKRSPRLPLFGVAFECQVLPELPREDHDVRVDTVVTETMIYNCRSASVNVKEGRGG